MKRRDVLLLVVGLCLFVGLGVHGQAQRLGASGSGLKLVQPDSSGSSSTVPAGPQAIVPRLMKFSGVLRDASGKPLTGTVDVTFALYSTEAGGNPLWFETQSVQTDELGRYTALLGAMHTDGLPIDLFTSGEVRWLGIQVGLEAEQQPRVLLVSVPYALKAGDAETLGGKPLSDFMLKDTSNTASGASGQTSSATTSSTEVRQAQSTMTAFSTNTTGSTPVTTAGGTVNYVPLWDSTSDITNSAIVQSNGNIGIGTTTPIYALQIVTNSPGNGIYLNAQTFGAGYFLARAGTLEGFFSVAGQAGGYSAVALGNDAVFGAQSAPSNGNLIFTTQNAAGNIKFATGSSALNDTTKMIITNAGNVGIGTSTPAAKLEVNGTAQFDAAATFAAGQTVTGNITASGTISGNGSGLTGVVSSGLAAGTYSNALTFSNAGNSFSGNGSGLTSLNPASIAAGTAGISVTGNAATATNALQLGGVMAIGYAPATGSPNYAAASGSTSYIANGTSPQTASLNVTGGGTFGGAINSNGLIIQPSVTDSVNCFASGNCVSANVLAGFSGATGGNVVAAGVTGATIAGGGGNIPGAPLPNTISDDWGTVGGGLGNTAGNGGGNDLAETVAGGFNNTANAGYSTVSGGQGNNANGNSSAIAGGYNNKTFGFYSTVAGGSSNTAEGDYSFVAGSLAHALNAGSFVWGDNSTSSSEISDTAANQFIVRAAGGVWFGTTSTPGTNLTAGRFLATSTGAYLTTGGNWTNNSDRNLKANFSSVSGHDLLAQLNAIPMTTWNYKAESPAVLHLGPMAQDFYRAFRLGADDQHITTVDEGGVALAGVQALYRLSLEKDDQIRKLTAEVDRLKRVETQMTALEARLSTLERRETTTRTARARNTPKTRKPAQSEIACVRF